MDEAADAQYFKMDRKWRRARTLRLPALSFFCTGVCFAVQAWSFVSLPRQHRGSQLRWLSVLCRTEDSIESIEEPEGPSRLEQIQAAMERGAAKAAREAAGYEPHAEEAPQQLTEEQEEALKSMFVEAGDADNNAENLDAIDAEFAVKAAEYRINRTLEFCPDGVLAREIINEMCANGTVPGPLAWNAVIDAFGQRGALDEALAVYREMQEARVAANDATYDVLAHPAMRRGEFRFVETLYGAKAVDRGGIIGAESLAILLQAYANGRPPQPEKAVTAFRCEMEASGEKGLPVVEVASGEVLQALRNAAGLNQSCELCWEYGIDPAKIL